MRILEDEGYIRMKPRWPILLLGILAISFFLPEFWGGKGLLYSDNLSHVIPTMAFWKQEILNGKIPLWNPYILGGIPFLADLSNNTLSPTNIAYLFLPIPLALNLLVVVYVALAAIFTYLYTKTLTGKTIPALFSAIAFAFSGTVIAGANDINSLQGICLIPLVLFASERFVQKSEVRRGIELILVLTLQFISSHPQYSYYTWIIVFFYLAYFLKQPFVKRSLAIGTIFVCTFLLSAFQLLPSLELSKEAFRPETAEFSSANQLKLVELPRLVLANLYGSWKEGSSWGPSAQLETGLANTEGYMGVLPLVLAVWGAFTIRARTAKFWMVVALFTFVLSLGSQTPLFELARRMVPFFTKFRSPIRILSIYSFGIAMLSGMALANREKKTK
ncbi:MAG: hypothetical protein A2900_03135 [Candidatus Chisholmbacteria bacterium RIFCSPLOWO2_01_FULL_50_28]|uniref:Glycosyltransferase RgtA/B/C/D-like domain-containing protein n=1 Tax=Candidatus Chisholmbacteria bacterium RIFCSPHIGHO2_01_FULL_52_32 TaxID=1797591 RepID=A0A1G1VT39_9BACT|nr:MAG: hypothetical protein A2786_03610 [Candidatus Chisholmbacteria bacterium RIFCSPHIGHO2_01_FULL_52_32]OGY20070.1 MAG: hypothetical protein A2900_03135 [Candidatus Chisholmbacteria bacterium RIFCSPLOWO2_01_FULL_50_28]